MPDRQVRVVCPRCGGSRVAKAPLKDYACRWCRADGTILATLADPEMAALIEDGKEAREAVEEYKAELLKHRFDPYLLREVEAFRKKLRDRGLASGCTVDEMHGHNYLGRMRKEIEPLLFKQVMVEKLLNALSPAPPPPEPRPGGEG